MTAEHDQQSQGQPVEYEFRGPGVQKKPQKRSEQRKQRSSAPTDPWSRPSQWSGTSGSSGPSQPSRPSRASTSRSLVQIFAAVVGAAFLLIGILGFVPGVTTNYDQLGFIGPDSQALLLGLFAVSVVHNIVHLSFGVAGLLAAVRASASVAFLIGGGLLYGVVFVYGILVERGSELDILPVNDADNILHIGLTIGMILLGVVGAALLRRGRARA